jgi:tRNA(Ile)-lysidine synthase
MPAAASAAEPVGTEEFAAAMARLGPFERRPAVAVAVSGGADSMALMLLADAWARARGGAARGLIVDHGLRPESEAEAALTQARLVTRGISAQVLNLNSLRRGPGLAARARVARYAALTEACATAGVLHLLLGHHAADQAETVAMRLAAGSGAAGLAGMAALVETAQVRLLRPLLAVAPARLRATLRAEAVAWVEDPSNTDPAAQRTRLRAMLSAPESVLPEQRAAIVDAPARGRARAARERALAALLARRARMAPEGFALLGPGALAPDALAALLRTLAGAGWAPRSAPLAALAAHPRPATLGGARIMRARRLSGGFLLLREAAAMAAPCCVTSDVVWDSRFRLKFAIILPEAEVGALGDDAARLPGRSDLPAAVRQTLPALRWRGKLVVAPHLGYVQSCGRVDALFAPTTPMAAAPFRP